MKIPETFVSENHEFEKEIGEFIKKTLVDKVLVENIAKELETYFDSKNLADRIKVEFRKMMDLTEEKNKQRKTTPNGYGRISLTKEERDSWLKGSTNDIINRLNELKPSIKEEEITRGYINSFSVITKDFSYKLIIECFELHEDRKTVTEEVKGHGMLGTKTENVSKTYENPTLKGEINYVKFNKEHHETLLRMLKEDGYKASVALK